MKLRSNADLNRISSAIARQLNRYFSDSIQPPDSIRQPVRLKLNMDFHPNDLLTENFVPSIQNMDTLRLGVEFYQKENLLMATMSLPYLNYGGNIIDSLGIKVNSTEDSAQFAFGFKHLDAAGFVMNPTYFNGNFSEDGLTLKFNSLDDNYQPFYVIQTQISGKNDSLNINIVPDNLLLKDTSWQIPEDNQLLIQNDKITARNFALSHNNQSVRVATDLINVEKNNIGIGFNSFSLSNIMALFNQDDHLADGSFQGNIVAVNPLDKLGCIADFSIDKLEVLQAPLGNLNLKAITQKDNQYSFNMNLEGKDVNLGLQGDYIASESPHFNLNMDINRVGMETIDKLSGKSIENGSGYISGKLAVQGPAASPEYNGFIKFN